MAVYLNTFWACSGRTSLSVRSVAQQGASAKGNKPSLALTTKPFSGQCVEMACFFTHLLPAELQT